MSIDPDLRLRAVECKATVRAAAVARAFVRAGSADRELLLAALDCEKWLAASCRRCQRE